jgi:glycine/D-amino acid oxidase-like deaminating enzyme
MPDNDSIKQAHDIAVIGAGIIGVACALQLARQGRGWWSSTAQEPGHGASFGNAGHLATEQVFPIADLSILKRLPAMLMDPMGPLRLDWKYMPRALPWFTRLLLNLRPAPFQRTVAGIRALNESSLGAWQRLLQAIVRPTCLKRTARCWCSNAPTRNRRSKRCRHACASNRCRWNAGRPSPCAMQAPQLSEQIQGGLFFPRTGHFLDPYRVVCELVRSGQGQRCAVLQAVRFWAGQLQDALWRVADTDQGTVQQPQRTDRLRCPLSQAHSLR